MTTSSSTAKSAYVTVEMHARRSSVEGDVQSASLAVAEWLDTQDTSTLASDFAEYAAEMDGADPTEGSRRYVEMWTRACLVGIAAATAGWAVPDDDISFYVYIEPRLASANCGRRIGEDDKTGPQASAASALYQA